MRKHLTVISFLAVAIASASLVMVFTISSGHFNRRVRAAGIETVPVTVEYQTFAATPQGSKLVEQTASRISGNGSVEDEERVFDTNGRFGFSTRRFVLPGGILSETSDDLRIMTTMKRYQAANCGQPFAEDSYLARAQIGLRGTEVNDGNDGNRRQFTIVLGAHRDSYSNWRAR